MSKEEIVNMELTQSGLQIIYNLLSERYHTLLHKEDMRNEEVFQEIEGLFIQFGIEFKKRHDLSQNFKIIEELIKKYGIDR
jgi:hypothetical protein